MQYSNRLSRIVFWCCCCHRHSDHIIWNELWQPVVVMGYHHNDMHPSRPFRGCKSSNDVRSHHLWLGVEQASKIRWSKLEFGNVYRASATFCCRTICERVRRLTGDFSFQPDYKSTVCSVTRAIDFAVSLPIAHTHTQPTSLVRTHSSHQIRKSERTRDTDCVRASIFAAYFVFSLANIQTYIRKNMPFSANVTDMYLCAIISVWTFMVICFLLLHFIPFRFGANIQFAKTKMKTIREKNK